MRAADEADERRGIFVGMRPYLGARQGRGRAPQPGRRARRLVQDHRGGRSPQRSGELHDVHRLRVHVVRLRAGQPAPQRGLSRFRSPRRAVQPDRLAEPRGPLGRDGRLARTRHGRARHSAQPERLRRPHVRDGEVLRRSSRRRLRRHADAQRAARRDHPGQGNVGHPSGAVAQRRVGRLRDHAVQDRDHDHQPAGGQLRPRRADSRHPARRRRPDESVQDGHHRRQRHPRLRRRLPGGRLLVQGRSTRRHPQLRGSVPGTGANQTLGDAAQQSDAATRTEDGSGPHLPRHLLLHLGRLGPGRRLGGGEHPRGDLRRNAQQGDVRHVRTAHDGPLLRRRLHGR